MLVILAVSLTACARISREECLTPDWYRIGFDDGVQGRVAKRVADNREACARYGLAAGAVRYTQGRAAGLEHYCAPQNGFGLALKGERYHGVCPADIETGFRRAYSAGTKIHDAQQQISRLGAILDINRSQLQTLMGSLRQKEAELLRGGISVHQRAMLRADMRELKETVRMVETEISGIESAIEVENHRLLSLRESVPYR